MKTAHKIPHTQAWLCPPGEGVFTVHTAKEHRDGLQKKLYPNAHGPEEVKKSWAMSWNQLEENQEPCLLGVCSDSGGGILRGANWGPLFLRSTLLDLFSHQKFVDLGDIRVIPHLLHDKYLNEQTIQNCRRALYGADKKEDDSYAVSPLSLTENFLREFYHHYPDKKVVALGGDHSVSYPLTKTYLQHKKKQGIKVAILHFDAHTDLLEERLGIDYCFGSWCTHILEYLPSPDHLLQIGIRSSGQKKEHWEKKFGVQQFWADEVHQQGADVIAQKCIDFLKKSQVDELYISFDIDALDSQYASATGTPESGGLSPEQSVLIIKKCLAHFPLTGADLVEVAPFVKTREDVVEPKTTLSIGAMLINTFLDQMRK